ncbi:50S ribosomal protein L33 [candidate division WWE3 bacterium]|nr:50S ribosomal protein L33 [candidate division WWE3 bacterium]
MASKKGNRVLIGLKCEETGMRLYVTQKNRISTRDKIRLRKYNPLLRRHTWFTEVKKLK